MAEHTQGPGAVGPGTFWYPWLGEHLQITLINEVAPEVIQDKLCLAATAPELLEALEMSVDFWTLGANDFNDKYPEYVEARRAQGLGWDAGLYIINRHKAAIAKTKGVAR